MKIPIAVDEVPDPEPLDVQIECVPDPEPPKVQTVSTYGDISVLIPFPSTSPPAEAPAKAPAKAPARAPAKAPAKVPASPAARIQAAFDSCLTVSKDHASDSAYVKLFPIRRDRLWRIQTGKVETMTTP